MHEDLSLGSCLTSNPAWFAKRVTVLVHEALGFDEGRRTADLLWLQYGELG